jgi:hypothetical protein
MYQYEYVTLDVEKGLVKVTLNEHRAIIDEYAQKGYRYAGYIPTKETGYGILAQIDLVFEKSSQ